MDEAGIATGQGLLALVTRPEPQAGAWVSKLRAQGVRAQALPLMRIAAAPEPAAVREMFAAVAVAAASAEAPLVMFVSPNAAAHFFECLATPLEWPGGALAAATGPGTVAALRAAGVPQSAIVAPPAEAAQFDSEALWALLRGQAWQGRPAWIVRGDGGRDWFAETLRAEGARVAFVQAYARGGPQLDAAQQALLQQALAHPQTVRWLLSSSESVGHLGALAPSADWAAATALASHPRIAESARQLGFGRVIEVRPTVEAVAQAMRA